MYPQIWIPVRNPVQNKKEAEYCDGTGILNRCKNTLGGKKHIFGPK
jgi:hypothetical protein